ncbi:MAG TPA: PIN domain-containing protein [Thermomicrobiales bacterium]|jgi:predicted nucleic acid-binding protein|nr:PIN domain-containing protein [Thermomicrobiales bacterium]
MAQLIDTSVFIQLERRGLSVEMAIGSAIDESYALAAITAAELLYGVERANTPERLARRTTFVEAMLSAVPVIPFDLPVAREHARLWARLDAAGRRIGPYDLLVAATALAIGYDVLTFNVGEFERVPGLTVLRPNW